MVDITRAAREKRRKKDEERRLLLEQTREEKGSIIKPTTREKQFKGRQKGGTTFLVPESEFRGLERLGKTGETEAFALGRAKLRGEQEEEARRIGFQKETDSDILKQELIKQTLEAPSLEPERLPVLEPAAELGLKPAEIGGGLLLSLGEKVTGKKFGRPTAEELAKTTAGKALGIATLGAGIALAAAVAAPYVVALAAKTGITKAIIGAKGSSTLLAGAVGAIALGLGVDKVFDYRGAEMDVYRASLKKVVEDGERLEAATRNGYPTTDSLFLLTTIAGEVAIAERRIKELGLDNIQFQVSKEYFLDTQNVRSARLALVRRIEAVENIAITGQAAFNPEALMYNVAGFEGVGGEE